MTKDTAKKTLRNDKPTKRIRPDDKVKVMFTRSS